MQQPGLSTSSSNGQLAAAEQQQHHGAAAAVQGSSNGAPSSSFAPSYDEDTVEGIQMGPQKTIAAGLEVRVRHTQKGRGGGGRGKREVLRC